jgi:hypothetical protein
MLAGMEIPAGCDEGFVVVPPLLPHAAATTTTTDVHAAITATRRNLTDLAGPVSLVVIAIDGSSIFVPVTAFALYVSGTLTFLSFVPRKPCCHQETLSYLRVC